MKKRTTITTEKREVWIISEEDPQSQFPQPSSYTDRADHTDTTLVTTEQTPTTTDQEDQPDEG